MRKTTLFVALVLIVTVTSAALVSAQENNSTNVDQSANGTATDSAGTTSDSGATYHGGCDGHDQSATDGTTTNGATTTSTTTSA